MSLREAVAHAIATGNMTHDADTETGVDLIGALARADKLGASLWRVTGNMDAGSFISAREYLTEALWKQHPTWWESVLCQIAQLALEEWLACQCRVCGGRKFTVNEETGTRSTCGACAGTGRGRHSDDERIARLGIPYSWYSKTSPVFDVARKILNAADTRVERQMKYQLEHRKPLKHKK